MAEYAKYWFAKVIKCV